jgi:hypothetical protein
MEPKTQQMEKLKACIDQLQQGMEQLRRAVGYLVSQDQ